MDIIPHVNFDKLKKLILKELDRKKLILFLDYDGTLTPIVAKPELAILEPTMRKLLAKLAKKIKVIIVSGRELSNIKNKVKLKSVFYVGNHGFEISGPHIKKTFFAQLSGIKKFHKSILFKLNDIPKIIIENKKFTLSIHYRLVSPSNWKRVKNTVNEELKDFPELRMRMGKKVMEIYPNVNWNKGDAVTYLLQWFQNYFPSLFPIYLGDDVTDEDGFSAVRGLGMGILVSLCDKPSKASYRLNDTKDVYHFLKNILELL